MQGNLSSILRKRLICRNKGIMNLNKMKSLLAFSILGLAACGPALACNLGNYVDIKFHIGSIRPVYSLGDQILPIIYRMRNIDEVIFVLSEVDEVDSKFLRWHLNNERIRMVSDILKRNGVNSISLYRERALRDSVQWEGYGRYVTLLFLGKFRENPCPSPIPAGP